MDRTGGGFAAGDVSEAHAITGKASPGIGCSYDAFSGRANGIKAYWAHILITHEMVNLFTGAVVSGGWPVDWWANHRSPFPLMTAVEIEYSARAGDGGVPRSSGTWRSSGRNVPELKDQYGWSMFRKAFRTAVEDGINWDAFGANPSAPANSVRISRLSTRRARRHWRHPGAAHSRLRYRHGEGYSQGTLAMVCLAERVSERKASKKHL